MDFRDSPAEAAFREEVRTWLAEHLVGPYAQIGDGRGMADEEHWDLRLAWEQLLGAGPSTTPSSAPASPTPGWA